MDYFQITGQNKLSGEVTISGAKNAALPILAATLLTDAPLHLSNVPHLKDVKTMISLLSSLGSEISPLENNTLDISAKNITNLEAPYHLVKTMRASILVLGPLLARFKRAKVSLPGGCAIGARPIDFHLQAFEKMGANFNL